MEDSTIRDDFLACLRVPEAPPLVVRRVTDEYTLCCMWEQGTVLVLLKMDIGETAEWAETLNCPLSLVK